MIVEQRRPADPDLRERDFKETKQLLDEINAAISGYDPVLKEPARDILLMSIFGWEARKKGGLGNKPEVAFAEPESTTTIQALTLKEYAERCMPRTRIEGALLGLCYLKKALGLRSATGRQLNTVLRRNGMGVSNIADAMRENVRLLRAENRIISGTRGTRHIRNEYAITDFGIQYVESTFSVHCIKGCNSFELAAVRNDAQPSETPFIGSTLSPPPHINDED
jgi:hypothetical protein